LLVAGPVVDAYSVEVAFLGTAGLLVLLAIGAALTPSLRQLDRAQPVQADPLRRAG
jgi:hypothetical protein